MAAFPEAAECSRELLEKSPPFSPFSKGRAPTRRRIGAIAVNLESHLTSPFCKGGSEGDFDFLHGKRIHKGKKYGNLMACFVCCRVGGASGLHFAEAGNFNLNAECLPGGQPR
jgi:hypothetical protein